MFSASEFFNKASNKKKAEIPLDEIELDPIHKAFLEEVEIYLNLPIDTWVLEEESEELINLLNQEKDFILKVLLSEKNTDIKNILRELIKEIDSYDEETEASQIITRIQEFRIYYYSIKLDNEIISSVEETLKLIIKVRRNTLKNSKG